MRKRGFSLIELLISIAIIAVLLALLFPGLAYIRRWAIVWACPIVYVAKDNTVWICDREGKRHLQVSEGIIAAPLPRWSPKGRRIGVLAWNEKGCGTAIIDPLSGKTVMGDALESPCWIDDHTLIGAHYFGAYNELWCENTNTGRSSPWIRLQALGLPCGQLQVQYSPILTPGFVVSEADVLWAPTYDVVLRDQEWNLKKVIWKDANNDVIDVNAEVDYTGEWVAWTRGRFPGASSNLPFCVAMKPLDAPSGEPPILLGLSYESSAFCDWTPEGFLLVVLTQNGRNQLALMEKSGKLIRIIPTPNGISSRYGCATWRRYEPW